LDITNEDGELDADDEDVDDLDDRVGDDDDSVVLNATLDDVAELVID